MAERLKDKVAVVTGGAGGIGRGICLLMAQEGAKVVVNDVGSAVDGRGASSGPGDAVVREIREAGGTAIASYDSVATMEGAERIIKAAVDAFGRIDILVTAHGILRDRMIFNMTEEEWDAVIAVHLKGSFACAKFASLFMRQQRSGRIITFTSTSGLYGNSGQANYGAAKDGLAGFTRAAARELGDLGITVNSICPSAETRMMATVTDVARQRRAATGVQEPEAATAQLRGDPLDVAPMVVYLASDEAASINGQIFYCSGGMISLLSHPDIARSIHKQGRWTYEEIAAAFPATLGQDLANPAPPIPPREV